MPFRENQDICVLAIDDESAVLLTIKAMLEYSGFKAITARNSAELTEVMHKSGASEPDVVVLDSSISGMDLKEAVLAIRNHNPQAAFLLTTRDSNQLDETLINAIQPAGYLTKPYTEKMLTDRIQTLFEKA